MSKNSAVGVFSAIIWYSFYECLKLQLIFWSNKALEGRSSDAVIHSHRRKQGALTEFLFCYSIKHHFRNHNKAIVKLSSVREHTHTSKATRIILSAILLPTYSKFSARETTPPEMWSQSGQRLLFLWQENQIKTMHSAAWGFVFKLFFV